MTMGAVSMHPALNGESESDLETKINPPSKDACLPVATEPLETSTGDIPSAWLVEAHPGAGVDTVEQIFRPFFSSNAVIPAANDWPAVVIVASSHMPGVVAAHRLVRQFRSGAAGAAHLLGVLLVDQSDEKYPKELTRRIDTVRALVPSIWTMRYVPAWRELLIDQRPVWFPNTEIPTGKAAKKIDPATYVPADIQAIGQEIHDTSLELHSQLND